MATTVDTPKLDILGLLSIIAVPLALAPLGIIFGLIGARIAKKEHRSPVLSRIGWILNLALTLISIGWVISILLTKKYQAG